jgi:hypothetical protein
MPGPKTVLSSGKTLGEVCRAADLSEAALGLLVDGTDGPGFVGRLVTERHFSDAVRLLSHALPSRPAVWWAMYCARRAHGDTPPAKVEAALEATKQWIAEPNEKNQREAMRWAREVDFRTPAGCAALAAFFSGDSIGPPDRDPVPPEPYTAAKVISGCISLAAVFAEPQQAEQKYQDFIRQGLEVADKTRLWVPGGRPPE